MRRKPKEEMFENAKSLIAEHDLIFIEDVAAFLAISKATFYDRFKLDSYELNELKKLLDKNKVSRKVEIRKKWNDSDNPTSQMALYKLLATDEERKRLSQTFIELSGEQEKPVKVKFNFGK